MHQRNIRALAKEIYKVIQGISSPILNEVFKPCQCNYDLRGYNFLQRRVKSVRYDIESISFLASKICKMLPQKINDLDTLQTFKARIKK